MGAEKRGMQMTKRSRNAPAVMVAGQDAKVDFFNRLMTLFEMLRAR
jgi:hypothetical protein